MIGALFAGLCLAGWMHLWFARMDTAEARAYSRTLAVWLEAFTERARRRGLRTEPPALPAVGVYVNDGEKSVVKSAGPSGAAYRAPPNAAPGGPSTAAGEPPPVLTLTGRVERRLTGIFFAPSATDTDTASRPMERFKLEGEA